MRQHIDSSQSILERSYKMRLSSDTAVMVWGNKSCLQYTMSLSVHHSHPLSATHIPLFIINICKTTTPGSRRASLPAASLVEMVRFPVTDQFHHPLHSSTLASWLVHLLVLIRMPGTVIMLSSLRDKIMTQMGHWNCTCILPAP